VTSHRPLLLIGGPPDQLQKAHALGLDIIYCQFPEEFKPEYSEMIKGAILADYTDWDTLRPLVRAAHEVWRFPAAVSLTEAGLEPCGRVNDLLGLGGTSYAVSHRFTDKLVMRRHLAAEAPGSPSAIAAAPMTGASGMLAFGAEHGYPFIVKPARGTASFGVLRVTGPESVNSVWQRVRELREDDSHPLTRGFDFSEFMMEEYVDGAFHTVETFSFNGRHVLITITEATTLAEFYVHDGHAIPARLEPQVVKQVTDAVATFLDAMGLRDGPAHTEIKLTQRGPVVIESQNRVGGALFSDMMRAVYGIDPQSMAISWPLGLVDEPARWPAPEGGAASWLLLAGPGRIAQIRGLDHVRDDPATLAISISATPGDVVRQFDASWDGLGHVAARGADAGAASEQCRRLLSRIEVITESDEEIAPAA
jgi:ATP-grasp domain/L-amino acid ligase C-terminal domain 2